MKNTISNFSIVMSKIVHLPFFGDRMHSVMSRLMKRIVIIISLSTAAAKWEQKVREIRDAASDYFHRK